LNVIWKRAECDLSDDGNPSQDNGAISAACGDHESYSLDNMIVGTSSLGDEN